MAELKGSKAAAWTDAEKLSILFQIIDKAGTVPYDELVLPTGRTKKAVQIMLGRERVKAKSALGSNTEAEGSPEADDEGKAKAAVAKKGKRKANGEADGAPKKTKAPRKKKAAAAKADSDADEANEEDEGPMVKDEPEGDD